MYVFKGAFFGLIYNRRDREEKKKRKKENRNTKTERRNSIRSLLN